MSSALIRSSSEYNEKLASVSSRIAKFPGSRYMGSKLAILPFIYSNLVNLEFDSAFDAFSGSGAVSYLLKAMEKRVSSNDFLRFAYHTANAIVANDVETLSPDEAKGIVAENSSAGTFVQDTFRDLYFSDDENQLLDSAVANIRVMDSAAKQSLAFAALSYACLRRRPRGLFTYVGRRYDDGRRDLRMGLEQHFVAAVELFNDAVHSNGMLNSAYNEDVFGLSLQDPPDLVYIDPPYVSPLSDNDYIRRYHFVEGLVRYWEGLEVQEATVTKKFRRFPSPFDSKVTVFDGFARLFDRYRDSILAVSYSSNGIPSRDELVDLLKAYKRNVVVHEEGHRYSFGTHGHRVGSNRNQVVEYLFIAE